MVTMVMHLEGSDDDARFTTIHENSNQMLRIAILDTKKVYIHVHCLFCVCTCVCTFSMPIIGDG